MEDERTSVHRSKRFKAKRIASATGSHFRAVLSWQSIMRGADELSYRKGYAISLQKPKASKRHKKKAAKKKPMQKRRTREQFVQDMVGF